MITLLNKFDDNYMMQKNDILDVVSLYMKENNLESHLKDIVFSNDSKYLGYYNLNTLEIVLNDDKITHFCYRLFDKLQRLKVIDEKYYAYYFNFYYLYIIFHELTHINQRKRYEDSINNGDVFCVLYELCRKIRNDDNSLYSKFHDLFPMEIDANNNGIFKAYQLMSYTKLPNKECRVMYLQYLRSLLFNYQKVNSSRIVTPLERLIKKSNNHDIDTVKLFDNIKLSRNERLNLGLNISSWEYENLMKEERKILIKTK